MANALIAAHIAFHRNVPMLVHILFWYFGVPALLPQAVADWLNSHGSEFILSCVAIGLVMSAYVCEDLRSAVRAIPPGVEAARAGAGLPSDHAQGGPAAGVPHRTAPLLNQTLLLVKNTSAMAIGVTELTAAGREIENGTFRTFEAYAVVTAIYRRCRSSSWAGRGVAASLSSAGGALTMWDILKDNWLLLLIGQYPHGPLGGLAATLGLAAISLVLALPCGVLLALGRISPWRCLRWPATAVVQLVRGLPLLMFIFWAYFFVPIVIGRPVAGTTTMVVALVCYESAYLAEIIRAGIQALPSGQQEAGRALGLSYLQTMRRVILPQALYNMLPSMLSQFVSTVKETSLAYVISVQELTYAANRSTACS